MKSVIEASGYLILMAIITFVCMDFYIMHKSLNKVTEVEQVVENYVEVYGQVQGNSLDDATVGKINELVEKMGMKAEFTYFEKTQDYTYFYLNLDYKVAAVMLHLDKTHRYTGIVRVANGVV